MKQFNNVTSSASVSVCICVRIMCSKGILVANGAQDALMWEKVPYSSVLQSKLIFILRKEAASARALTPSVRVM